MRGWLLASRPKTLPAAVVPVWLGVVLAWWATGGVDWGLGFCTLGCAVLIQIATNFFNDAIDFRKGADTGARLGPRRVTASGDLPARAVMWAGVIVLALAVALSVPMVLARGWAVVAIGLPSLYFSFGYTGGPLPLAYRGLGELFVVLFFGLVAVTGTVFVQTGEWMVEALVLGLQVGAFSTVLIAINNLRDVEEDRGSGKRTLAVRFGERFAKVEIAVLCLLPHVVGIYWLVQGQRDLWLVPLGLLVLGVPLVRRVWRRAPGPAYNRYLGMGALQLVLFAVLFSLGVW